MYEFSTSQALGLTAMVQARDTSETLLGVFAMDYDVGALSAIVNGSLSGEGAWGFAVERGNGLLVAITTGEKLYDKAAVAQVGFANSRLRAADVAHPSIAAAATFLAEQNWPANIYHRAGNLSVGYEFQSDELTLNGLDWLVVVGMDIRCGENEVWTSAGRCSVCPGGTRPAESGLLCEVCPSGTAGGDGNRMPGVMGVCSGPMDRIDCTEAGQQVFAAEQFGDHGEHAANWRARVALCCALPNSIDCGPPAVRKMIAVCETMGVRNCTC
jgi:hypothetical protein